MLEVFLTFLRLGVIGFGGPIALVSIIEREVCQNKKWLTLEQFAEIFSVCKLLPGALAVQVAICCGYRRRGRLGGLLAALGFLLPALILIIILGHLYQHNLNTTSPVIADVFKMMQDATLAIIVLTTWDLGKAYIKNFSAGVICLVCVAIIYVHPGWEPLAIILFGLAGLSIYRWKKQDLSALPAVAIASLPQAVKLTPHEIVYGKLLKLFYVCIKAGEFSFGTGLAIIPLLHGDLVGNYHWLSDKQFLDGITLGQVTPGPTTISIVFFGLLTSGVPGLIISIIGFYIPPLFNTLVIMPLFWQRMTGSVGLRVFTMWAFPAVIGGILSATIKLGVAAISGWYDWLLIGLALILIRRKVMPLWLLIPLYGVSGLIFAWLFH